MAAPTRIGLMGFGRIGRNVFRQLEGSDDLQVAAISDIADPAALVYLLKYDTIFGRFPKPVSLDGGELVVEDRRIPILDAAKPGEANWKDHGVDIVLQATRKHRNAADCRRHLDAGASRVVLASTPAALDDMDTLISGVNDSVLTPETEIIALGSNTANALGPVLAAMDEAFGIDKAMFTVVHAFTNEQRLADVPGDGLRTSRAAAENIIPAATTSPAILERVLPHLEGKISGMALNVPVADGSNVDLVAFIGRDVSPVEVNDAMREVAEGNGVIEYTDEPIVSSDVIGNTHSAIWDGLATMVMGGTMVKGIVWFDNGWGYSARAVEVMGRLAAFAMEGAAR